MLSKSSAVFFGGYALRADLSGYCPPDQIIVTGIPEGTHFKFMSPEMILVLKGKGTIEGTNAFGAVISAPHFQWVDIISEKEISASELYVSQDGILCFDPLSDYENIGRNDGNKR